MKKVIYKYLLDWRHWMQGIQMPYRARIISAQVIRGDIAIWAEVDLDGPKAMHWFYLVRTGEGVPQDGKYIATLALHEGDYIIHLYDCEDIPEYVHY